MENALKLQQVVAIFDLKNKYVYASLIIDRGEAWVMPESKYSIGG